MNGTVKRVEGRAGSVAVSGRGFTKDGWVRGLRQTHCIAPRFADPLVNE